MCVSQRGRRDLRPTVSFLSQRVDVCVAEDYAKLRRFTRHMKERIYELLCLDASYLNAMINFVCAVCRANDDCKSCSGAASTMGYGVLASPCVKQKINVNVSAESELVCVAYCLPKV